MILLRRYQPYVIAVIAVALIVVPGGSRKLDQASTQPTATNGPAAAAPEPTGQLEASAVTTTSVPLAPTAPSPGGQRASASAGATATTLARAASRIQAA